MSILRQVIDFILCSVVLGVLALPVTPAAATEGDGQAQLGPRSGEPLPRFTSLGDKKVYMRRGPGTDHPIVWVYVREDLPVEIIEEYDDWRRVRDIDGATGWIKKTKLNSQRHVLIRPPAGSAADKPWPLRAKPNADSPPIAAAEPGVVAELRRCPNAWCEIKAGRVTGWVERSALWGIYPTEVLN